MATISIHIQDDLLDELNKRSAALNVSKAEYIRQAIIAMNIQADRDLRKKRITGASRRVREESMQINAEFDVVEDPSDA